MVVPPDHPVMASVQSSRLCLRSKSASFVRHIEIDVSDTPLAGAFAAGQSIGVLLPGEDGAVPAGQPRPFSIASPSFGEDGEGRVLAITPKRIIVERRPFRPDDDSDDHRLIVGRASNYLCDLRPGDPVCLCGPFAGSLALPDDPAAHQYVFAATGNGVAPFRGMILELLRSPAGPVPGEIHMLAGAPYTSDLIYDDLFRELEAEFENFHYHAVVSREPDASGDVGRYVHHFLEREIRQFEAVLRNARTRLYLCGLGGMEHGLHDLLDQCGLADRYLVTAEASGRTILKPTERCCMEVFAW